MELFLIYSDYLLVENTLTSTRCKRKSVICPDIIYAFALSRATINYMKQPRVPLRLPWAMRRLPFQGVATDICTLNCTPY